MSEDKQLPDQATLLLVDDEEPILNALRRILALRGYRVLTAGGGAAGLEILEREPVDLILSDMRMPGMTGAQFLAEARRRKPDVARLLLTGYADMESTIAAINEGGVQRYLNKPWDNDELVRAVEDGLERRRLRRENARLLAEVRARNAELAELNADLERRVEARTAELGQTVKFLELAQEQQRKAHFNVVSMLIGLIELRAASLGGHGRKVAELALRLADKLGLDNTQSQDVMFAGLFHDIGKISLPDGVIDKPFSELAGEERQEVMRHPVKGWAVLGGLEGFAEVATMVRHHHETFDGRGYPDGLSGLAIPLGARILAVANDYDALQNGSLTRRPMNPAQAYAHILEGSGGRYDPMVVDAFMKSVKPPVTDKEQEMLMQTRQLRPGMVLTRDLMHRDGYLLLARGTRLDTDKIEQLRALENLHKENLVVHVRFSST